MLYQILSVISFSSVYFDCSTILVEFLVLYTIFIEFFLKINKLYQMNNNSNIINIYVFSSFNLDKLEL